MQDVIMLAKDVLLEDREDRLQGPWVPIPPDYPLGLWVVTCERVPSAYPTVLAATRAVVLAEIPAVGGTELREKV